MECLGAHSAEPTSTPELAGVGEVVSGQRRSRASSYCFATSLTGQVSRATFALPFPVGLCQRANRATRRILEQTWTSNQQMLPF
eukprot:scaffold967_cov321-Pavlova_lutheri.AAC.40